jgi:hypothetical protein
MLGASCSPLRGRVIGGYWRALARHRPTADLKVNLRRSPRVSLSNSCVGGWGAGLLWVYLRILACRSDLYSSLAVLDRDS